MMLDSNVQKDPGHSIHVAPGADVDEEANVEVEPSPSLCLWMEETKSEPSSCFSSRANSVLSLTDTEQERKSVSKNGKYCLKIILHNTMNIT